MTTQTLENKVEKGEKELIVNCGYCHKKLNPTTAYESPYGGKYCDKHCFDMFTED